MKKIILFLLMIIAFAGAQAQVNIEKADAFKIFSASLRREMS